MGDPIISVGVDVGTECIKVAVLDDRGTLLGSSIVARRGYFQDRVAEAVPIALEDAGVIMDRVAGVCATGFAENCVTMATTALGDAACHALGAFHYRRAPMTVIDIGGRDPKAIQVDERGRPLAIQTLRRCAAGIGTFLIFAARHLDVHPSNLQEMAARTDEACDVGSYCSMFGGQDILEKLRDGVSRESVALGCIESIADRVLEIGRFTSPLLVTGGVAEYFPGVLAAISRKTGLKVEAIPQPILAGATGAALWVFQEQGIALSREGENR